MYYKYSIYNNYVNYLSINTLISKGLLVLLNIYPDLLIYVYNDRSGVTNPYLFHKINIRRN